MYSQKLHKLPQLGGWGEGERKLPERKHFGGEDDIPYRNLQVLLFYFSFRLIAFPQWMDKNEWMQGVHLHRILRRYFLGWQWPAVKTYRWTLPHSTYTKKTSLQKDDHPKRKHLKGGQRPKGGRNCAPKTLDSDVNFVSPIKHTLFVAILRFVAIFAIAHLSLPLSNGWVALSFLFVRSFVRSLSRHGNIRPNLHFYFP